MVTDDGNARDPLCKRTSGSRRDSRARRRRDWIRWKSRRLVRWGKIRREPCLRCQAEQKLTIHHVGPLRADRFVFLCESCHEQAHRPIYQMVRVLVARGLFSVRPEAAIRRRVPASARKRKKPNPKEEA